MDQAVDGTTSATYDGENGFAFTVYDTDGIDHFNFSHSDRDQLIDLRAERASNVFRDTDTDGEIGNLLIARGSVIENATGGMGADLIIGNGAANRLHGFAGDDRIVAGDGDDTLIGWSGRDVLEGGGGADLLNAEASDPGFDAAAARIYRLYQSTLDRAPDRNGHSDWLDKLRSGAATEVQIAQGFVASSEFQSTYGATDDTQFVTLLYDNVLGRDPDGPGLADWVGKLDSGEMTRAEVVLGFSNSAEFIDATALAAMAYNNSGAPSQWTDTVWRLYHATLDRDPDLPGFRNWTGELAEGGTYTEVAAGFIGSSEFQSTYGATDNTQFVTLLYDNVLNRTPDKPGLDNWVGKLDSGEKTRTDVVRGFAESAEFRSDTRESMHDWIAAKLEGDRLIAEGKDGLFAGLGADTFVFDATLATDAEIAGLEAWDEIELVASTFSSGAEAQAALVQSGNDTLLVDGQSTIRFLDTALAEIAADQFQFV